MAKDAVRTGGCHTCSCTNLLVHRLVNDMGAERNGAVASIVLYDIVFPAVTAAVMLSMLCLLICSYPRIIWQLYYRTLPLHFQVAAIIHASYSAILLCSSIGASGYSLTQAKSAWSANSPCNTMSALLFPMCTPYVPRTAFHC